DLEGAGPGGDGGEQPGGAAGVQCRRLARGWRHAWSPDAQRVAYVDGGAIWVADPRGGAPQQVAKVEGVVRWGPCWSPDGYHLAYEAAPDYGGTAAGFWVARADGSRAWRVTELVTWGAKCWKKDGSALLFLSSQAAPVGED
ncbi:MAG: hypothetical protein K6T75_05475, partial [Acetobacteraceae bacterium]|nr:hypothetical protein [Acetobacteraceae bacterium]